MTIFDFYVLVMFAVIVIVILEYMEEGKNDRRDR
jgi:predicted outer membrane lipoprotein